MHMAAERDNVINLFKAILLHVVIRDFTA